MHKGAQQPGMTGQVKEDILTRMSELGVKMKEGKLVFQPQLLLEREFLKSETTASFVLTDGNIKTMQLHPGSLAFTVCQVPVIYKKAAAKKLTVHFADGTEETFDSTALNDTISNKIFQRTGAIDYIEASIDANDLR
jgi:hypothetical protein